jgi:hypothetical protein
MARHINHPSGPTVPVTVNLPPDHLKILDRLAEVRDMSRSQLIMRLLERAGGESVVGSKRSAPIPKGS